MDSAHLGSLIDILNILLNDRSALVLGAAISAFNDLIPTRMDLLHPHYRHLCRSLIDADEWGQVALLRVLAKYARLNFVDPGKATKLDPDLELLLKSSEPLLQSRNPSVGCPDYLAMRVSAEIVGTMTGLDVRHPPHISHRTFNVSQYNYETAPTPPTFFT